MQQPRMESLNKVLCAALLIFLSIGLSGCSNGEDAEEGVALMGSGEQEALYTAIQGFVGNGWNGSDLYPDPCGWTPIQGVSCDLFDGFWYVTDLNIGSLHDNSLSCDQTVKFSPQLFKLTHLKTLSFFNCFASLQHTITIPASTGTWERLGDSLESLDIRSNPGLIGQMPPNLSSLKKLQSLVVIENGLTGQIPSDLGSFNNLKRLVLSGNNLTGQIPDSFGNLTELLIMDLSRNSLSGSLPFTFGGLISLLKLDLSGNNLMGNIPKEMSKLKSLTLLDLRGNNLTGGLEIIPWWEMDSLEEMVLSNNPLGGELKGLEWERMKKLVVLDLSNVGLKGEVPEAIAGMERLRFLDLSNNNLTGKIPPRLAKMSSLSALYLSKNNLGGEVEFPDWFFGKMGRRLGLAGNPKLCYSDSNSSPSGPVGVEACQSEVTFYDQNLRSSLGGGGGGGGVGYEESLLMGSWGGRIRCGFDGFWWVETLIVVGLVY